MIRSIGRGSVVALALVVLLAAPAAAHVAVTPEQVPAGEQAELTFHVPNEEATANTTRVEIALPEGVKLDFVDVKPVPGWTHTETKAGDAITRVAWEGGTITPGEFQEFSLTIGPIAGKALVFKALQTYDNGDVVRWIDETVAGKPEPDHPAPTVTVVAAADTGAPSTASATTAKGDGADPLEFVALAVGGLALVAALAALVMGPKRPPA
ncbi:MAG: hypothetical protein QOI47_2237 [Actinomycetota bacterium]|nr:hypothetical protein [Actinomycetota bacterium]